MSGDPVWKLGSSCSSASLPLKLFTAHIAQTGAFRWLAVGPVDPAQDPYHLIRIGERGTCRPALRLVISVEHQANVVRGIFVHFGVRVHETEALAQHLDVARIAGQER